MNRKAHSAPFQCPSCRSSSVTVLHKWRYLFMTSMLPVLVILAAGIFFEPLFLLFLPAVIVTNYIIAGKKTPMLICRGCRHIEKGSPAPLN
ncbi:hypothetical protein MM300_12700 [Evansella sp. LMS18]|uniref:hypothetical protein n=1 Tax=Evansella sp. LMS18 TaxID=2924033 RepID=UPI0020D0614A|nr:hypothetical protein [Evansella sp. LMS18]UTR08796.1 hypothetical protein MM300_12700 [Evansella sp. LMS18]